MKRQTRRRQLLVTSYTDFPPQYAELLERFKRDGHVTMGPMPRRNAKAMQFQLHRWFGFLRNAPPDDEYAHGLSAIAKTMQCSLIHVDFQRSDDDPLKHENMVLIDWHLDPITKYMASTTPREEPPC